MPFYFLHLFPMNSELPPELRNRDGMVHVNMEDHRHEEYKPVAKKYKPFAGKGHTLGSPTPAVTESSNASVIPSSTSSASNAENEQSYAIKYYHFINETKFNICFFSFFQGQHSIESGYKCSSYINSNTFG